MDGKASTAGSEIKKITLSHGGGGKDMRDLIEQDFVKTFANEFIEPMEDQAKIPLAELSKLGNRLAFTTDSYVVDPIFFPGGDIGSLAVNGTVNDLAVGGAIPLYLSCSLIIEEGFAADDLRRIINSMKLAADRAGVMLVTGDTKVVNKNACDKIFINTAGIGVIPENVDSGASKIQAGDLVILSGAAGAHGACILAARADLKLMAEIKSDCRSLNRLTAVMRDSGCRIHAMRDATRGGIAAVLNEFAETSNLCISIEEKKLKVQDEVRGLCEILGLDPLYLANEGTMVVIVAPESAELALAALKADPDGQDAAIIGKVLSEPKKTVILETTLGAQRLVDMPVGEQLPRIC